MDLVPNPTDLMVNSSSLRITLHSKSCAVTKLLFVVHLDIVNQHGAAGLCNIKTWQITSNC